jgi:hypothetical protein
MAGSSLLAPSEGGDSATWASVLRIHAKNDPSCPVCKARAKTRLLERKRRPSLRTMEKWMSDGVAKAVDGCRVEPDGVCPHGSRSWLLELGLI